MPRRIFVAYNARLKVAAELTTRFAGMRAPVVARLQEAWDAVRPIYVGPANNRFKNTLKDFADNPEHYGSVSRC